MKKYYEAYDERYKEIHKHNIKWFGEDVTPELSKWLNDNTVSKEDEICEVGCGEGRDCLHLAKMGYKLTGIDISQEAIRFAEELANKKQLSVNFQCLDATKLQNFTKKFKYVYSIGTLHMLVLEEDRLRFLASLYHLLEDDGKCLLVNMGDGIKNYSSDTTEAFQLTNRTHMETRKEFNVATTSFRSIDFRGHLEELDKARFKVLSKQITYNKEYNSCMTMYLVKK